MCDGHKDRSSSLTAQNHSGVTSRVGSSASVTTNNLQLPWRVEEGPLTAITKW